MLQVPQQGHSRGGLNPGLTPKTRLLPHRDTSPHTCQDGDYKKKERQVLVRMWVNYKPCILLVERQNGVAAMENTEFLQILKTELPYDPPNLTSEY